MISTVMGWVGLSKLAPWLQELVFIAVVVLLISVGYGIWHHKVYDAGKNAEIAAIKKQADKDTAAQAERAKKAEKSYADEHQANLDYQSQHPDAQPVRLCPKPASVRQASAPVKGAEGGPSTATNVPEVPSGDNQLRTAGDPPDIHGLLKLLALRADNVSAGWREQQAR